MSSLERNTHEYIEQLEIDQAAAERNHEISASGVIIVNKKRGIFLYQRDGEASKWPLFWQFPAGGRKNETLKACARREMREEVSWAPEDMNLIGSLNQEWNKEIATFWVVVSDEDADKLQLNHHPENAQPHGKDARWWNIDDAVKLSDSQLTPGTADLLHKFGTIIKRHISEETIPTHQDLNLNPPLN